MVRGGVQRVGQQIRRLGASADSTQASKTKAVVAPSTVRDDPNSSIFIIERKVVFLPLARPRKPQPFVSWRMAVEQCQGGVRSALIHEHQSLGTRQRSSRSSSKPASCTQYAP